MSGGQVWRSGLEGGPDPSCKLLIRSLHACLDSSFAHARCAVPDCADGTAVS